MSKMHYFIVTNFQKPRSFILYLRFWWHEVVLIAQIVVYQFDYDKINLKKISYDAVSVTSSLLRHRKTSPN